MTGNLKTLATANVISQQPHGRAAVPATATFYRFITLRVSPLRLRVEIARHQARRTALADRVEVPEER
jgi:hypothetical protein